MANVPLPDKDTIEQVGESRIYAYDSANSNYVALEVNGNGELEVAATFSEAALGIEDSTGTRIDPATETTLSNLADALASTAAADQDPLLVTEDTPLDVSAAKVATDPDTDDYGSLNGAALSANGTVTVSVATQGAEKLDGTVVSTGSYDCTIDWKDSAGNVLFSDTVASAVTGGTETDLNGVAAVSPYADVNITDTSAASQTATASVHMR